MRIPTLVSVSVINKQMGLLILLSRHEKKYTKVVSWVVAWPLSWYWVPLITGFLVYIVIGLTECAFASQNNLLVLCLELFLPFFFLLRDIPALFKGTDYTTLAAYDF